MGVVDLAVLADTVRQQAPGGPLYRITTLPGTNRSSRARRRGADMSAGMPIRGAVEVVMLMAKLATISAVPARHTAQKLLTRRNGKVGVNALRGQYRGTAAKAARS